jgi:hypothetical protein
VIRLAVLAAVVLLGASGCGSDSPHGGGVLVTGAGRIGSLQIDVSDWDAIVAFAGEPDTQLTTRGWPGLPLYHALGYGCDHKGPTLDSPSGNTVTTFLGCETTYFVNAATDRLVAFQTYSADFRTSNGIRPGTAQSTADRLEHQTPRGPWNAIGETSRGAYLILPSMTGNVFSLMLESRHHPIGLTFTE